MKLTETLEISTWGLIGISILVILVFIQIHNHFIEKLEDKKRIEKAELKVEYQNWAILELEKFKQNEMDKVRIDTIREATKSALVSLEQWKIDNEFRIRQDAINRSYSVNLGKITEHLIPFHKSFLAQFNPKDARFIGSPIDLIVFDGYADKRDDITIFFVEIKTGSARLSKTQESIKDAVGKQRIRWAEVNPDKLESNEFPF